jgi:hypothetical protein
VAWWGFVARYSGATVPDSHGVPRHLAAKLDGNPSRNFKERFWLIRFKKNCKGNFIDRKILPIGFLFTPQS